MSSPPGSGGSESPIASERCHGARTHPGEGFAGAPPHNTYPLANYRHGHAAEVTESQLMQYLRIPLEILTRLRLERFSVSIDDFGTGNSSLTQLRDLPFDEFKIDQRFVHRACENEKLR